jgi:hypothetical protein
MKSSGPEVAQRVEEVFRLRLGGAEFADIRQFASAPERNWSVSDRQLWRYISAADKLVKERFDAKADHLLARHLLQRRPLYAHAVGAGDFSTALRILDSEAKLEGLFPPTKIAPTNPAGDLPYGADLSPEERPAPAPLAAGYVLHDSRRRTKRHRRGPLRVDRAGQREVILVLDATGCGRPVVDIFRRYGLGVKKLAPVTITAGSHATCQGGWWTVPKRDLAGAVAVGLEQRTLRIAPGLKLAPVLAQELTTFRVKTTAAGNETFESWRERDHDDLVLAVALAVHFGARLLRKFRMFA